MSIGTVTAPVEQALQEVEALLYRQAEGFHPDLEAALHHLLQAGGKRIRPTVALLSGRLVRAEEDRLITFAAALEMLHTATLVHDDLIDGALLRRGVPTLNARWSPAATVLTGDFLFARAARLITQTRSVPVIQMFAETLSIIVNGEIHQLFEGGHYTDVDAYYQRIYAKTASVFELATVAACFLGHATKKQEQALRQYGYAVGMAFQIMDDVLDFQGNVDRMGKPVGHDLRNGLITLPSLLYYQEYPQDPLLRRLLDGERLPHQEMETLIGRIQASSALAQAREQARRFIQQAVHGLEQAFPPCPEREALVTLAHYIVDRDR